MSAQTNLNEVPPTLAFALQHIQSNFQTGVLISTNAIAQVDAFLGRLQALARSELNRRQATTRVFPTEVLSIIFRYVILDEDATLVPSETAWRSSSNTNPNARVNLLGICRQWRDILLNLPAAWNVITDDDAENSIQRSDNLPVSVFVQEISSELISRLPHLGPRLYELFWAADYDEGPKVATLTFPAPQLRALYLRDNYPPDGANIHASLILFSGYVPQLRRLHLCSVEWLPGNNFAVLTHLCLENVYPPVAFSRILALLAQCPQLKHLAFKGDMPLPGNATALPQRPDDERDILPQLRWLSFDAVPNGFLAEIVRFLASRQPTVAIQALRIPIAAQTPPLSIAILPFVASYPFTQLSVLRRNWHSRIAITATNAHNALRLISAASTLEDAPLAAAQHTAWALNQLDQFALAEIEVYQYGFVNIQNAQVPPDVGGLLSHLQRMTRLREFRVSTNDLKGLLTILYRHFLPTWQTDQAPFRLPTLLISVSATGAGQRLNRENFYVAANERERLRNVLAVDKVAISCSLDRRVFEHTLRTLETLCSTVEYGNALARTDALPVVSDGTVNPAWEDAHWDVLSPEYIF